MTTGKKDALEKLKIRTTEEDDLPVLLEIYNEQVTRSTATLDLDPKSISEWKEWFGRHGRDNHPLLTAVLGDKIVGYASLSPFRDMAAYRSTVELSVYIAEPFRGRGIGSALLDTVLDIARSDPTTLTVVSVITSDNEKSIRLHEKHGFTYCGTLPAAAEKFGRLLAVELYTLWVGPGSTEISR